jgi:protein-S-isoprenylcysteine O-methyltransferase Ste14
MNNRVPLSSLVKTVAATAAFAVLHSALADARVKHAAERVLGTRRRNALYRPAYNAVAVATSAALLAYVGRLPDRTLYHVRGPAAVALRLGQFAGVAGLLDSMWRAGPLRFAGVPGLIAWFKGRMVVPREPEGQSPPPDPDGAFRPRGVFRLSRQPANASPIPLLWLNPKMTANLAAFNAAATLYLYLGSFRTERRLREAYGEMYAAYQRGGVPMFLPRAGGVKGPTPLVGARRGDEGVVGERKPWEPASRSQATSSTAGARSS